MLVLNIYRIVCGAERINRCTADNAPRPQGPIHKVETLVRRRKLRLFTPGIRSSRTECRHNQRTKERREKTSHRLNLSWSLNRGRLDHSMKIPDIFSNYGRFRAFCKWHPMPAVS
jgi:hypothetical protein